MSDVLRGGNIPRLPVDSHTLTLRENVPLGPMTTIGIGGPARWFVDARSTDELIQALTWARANEITPLILGGGSNVLIADSGWPGLVIRMGIEGIIREADGPQVRLIAAGGVQWDELVRESVEADLQGIECLSGIPGTVGASPVQNIGAYGQEVKDTIEWVEAVDRTTDKIVRFSNADCGFAYRWSRFKGEDKDRYIVTRVSFLLAPGGRPQLRYGDLTRYFEQHANAEPSLAQVRDAVIQIRSQKGMVVSADIPDSRSCGSFFMNPIVAEDRAEEIETIARDIGAMPAGGAMPRFPAEAGHVKLSAAWLMERSGLMKGESLGNVGLSTCHVLAIVNRGGGTANEVLQLVTRVQNRVKETFGVELVPEPVFIGF